MPAAKQDTPEQVVASLLARSETKRNYIVADSARRAPVGDGTFVTRGARVTRTGTGADSLVHENGTAQQGQPLIVACTAIMHGILSPAEVAALQEAGRAAGYLK